MARDDGAPRLRTGSSSPSLLQPSGLDLPLAIPEEAARGLPQEQKLQPAGVEPFQPEPPSCQERLEVGQTYTI